MKLKKCLFLAVVYLLLLSCAPAQDSGQTHTTTTIIKLNIGDTARFDSKGIEFIRVIEDSRCPSDLTCVWAGAIKVRIALYENNVIIKEKTLVFEVEKRNSNAMEVLLEFENKNVFVQKIGPYPTSEKPIDPKQYYLELMIK